jgi:hypothetical protein
MTRVVEELGSAKVSPSLEKLSRNAIKAIVSHDLAPKPILPPAFGVSLLPGQERSRDGTRTPVRSTVEPAHAGSPIVMRAEMEVGPRGFQRVGFSEVFLLLAHHAVSVRCSVLSSLGCQRAQDFTHLLATNHSPHVVLRLLLTLFLANSDER